jgi:hypothetical protein
MIRCITDKIRRLFGEVSGRIQVWFWELTDLVDQGHWLLVSTFLLYACVIIYVVTWGKRISGDSPPTAFLPVSILKFRTLRLDPFINNFYFFDLENHPHYLAYTGGHYYSKYSPLTSLLVLPIYGLDFLVFGPPSHSVDASFFRYLHTSRLSASIIEALVVVVVFLTLRRVVSQSKACCLALGYALGTYSWAAATNTLTTINTGELFIAVTLLALVHIDVWDRSRWWIPVALGSVALSVAARPQLTLVGSILGIFILAYSIRQRLLRLWYFIVPLSVGGGLIIYNYSAFGSVIQTGYGLEATEGWSTPLWEGLTGILFSPAHGLLMYSPLLVLSGALGIVSLCKRTDNISDTHRGIGFVAIGAVLAQLILMSNWWAWYGGAAYNQRMLMEVHPLLVFLGALGLKQYARSAMWMYALSGAWGAVINLARSRLYDLHLSFMEVYHSEIVWSVLDSELMMYVRWHGLGHVVLVVIRQAVICLAILSLGILLLKRVLVKRQRLDPVS